MVEAAKIDDFVIFAEGGKKIYWRVKSVSGDKYVITDSSGKEHSAIPQSDVEVSAMARMRMNAAPNTVELAENVAAILGIFFFSSFMSFAFLERDEE